MSTKHSLKLEQNNAADLAETEMEQDLNPLILGYWMTCPTSWATLSPAGGNYVRAACLVYYCDRL